LPLFFDPGLKTAIVDAIDRQTAQLAELTAMQATISLRLGILADIAESQRSIAHTLDKIYRKLSRPQPPERALLVVISENGNMLQFKITPPWDTADTDVVSAELTYTIGSADPVTATVLRGESLEGLEGNDGETVHVDMLYVDDATPTPNKSTITPADYVLADTIAPAAPGEAVLEVTGEV